jgi:hypothetical protein
VSRALRVLRRIRGAARAHGAFTPLVALRAVRLVRRGWYMGDLALLGLLDPRSGPARERWAVRRRDIEELLERLNPSGAVDLVQDKLAFATACGERGLPTPPVLAALARSPDRAATVAAWAGALERGAPEEFVVKPVRGQRGIGVRVLDRRAGGAGEPGRPARPWSALAAELEAGPGPTLLLQPRLRSREDVRRLSGRDALQTYRVVTLLDEHGRARVLHAILRLVVGDVLLDGFRSHDANVTGNLIARVQGDGTLAASVGVAPSGFGLVRVPRHPHSGVVLAGAPAPGWDEARDLALRAAEAFDELRSVGWDVAVTEDGPVLVEGNAWWGASADPDGALLGVRDALAAAAEAAGRPAGQPSSSTPKASLARSQEWG